MPHALFSDGRGKKRNWQRQFAFGESIVGSVRRESNSWKKLGMVIAAAIAQTFPRSNATLRMSAVIDSKMQRHFLWSRNRASPCAYPLIKNVIGVARWIY